MDSLTEARSPGAALERLMDAAPDGVEPATAVIARTDPDILTAMVREAREQHPDEQNSAPATIREAQWNLSRPARRAATLLVTLAMSAGIGGITYKAVNETPDGIHSANYPKEAKPMGDADKATVIVELAAAAGFVGGLFTWAVGGTSHLADRAAHRRARKIVSGQSETRSA